MTPWIKYVEKSKEFLTLYLPPCILQKQTHTWAREVRVRSMILVKARRLVRKGTAPVCLVLPQIPEWSGHMTWVGTQVLPTWRNLNTKL
jgi:hypothetical protein